MADSIRSVMVQTITELPVGTIVWRTMSRNYTREDMILQVLNGSEVGQTYCSEVIRVSRDIILRSVKRGKNQEDQD